MASRCDCCATSKRVTRFTTGGRYHADLCPDCAQSGHGLEDCLLCTGRVWRCQRIVHMHAQHRHMLEFVMNAPEQEFAAPKAAPTQTYLGTLRLGPRGEGLDDA